MSLGKLVNALFLLIPGTFGSVIQIKKYEKEEVAMKKILAAKITIVVVLLGCWALGCNVISLPDVEGTWDLTFYVEQSNCPDVISPPMSHQVWEVTQEEDQVIVVIKTVDGEEVGFQFVVAATLQQDGNFSFNETFTEYYKDYHLRLNIICNATVSGNSISGVIQLSLLDLDTNESCVEKGRVEGTRRT